MSQKMNWKKFYINNCIDSNDELKEIDIKNCKCYYFDDIIKTEDSDINTTKKPYKNILVYNILYKTLINFKSWHTRFNKIDRYIRVYDGTRY